MLDAGDRTLSDAERLDWLRLIRSRRVGAVTFHRLLADHSTPRAALDALPDIASAAGVERYTVCPAGVAEHELRAGRAAGARLLCYGDAEYPAALRDLPDAPPVLWAIGDVALLNRPAIALVGARNASSLGLRMARRLAETLGAAGFVTVSGLARGIDAEAHAAALDAGTVAVMAGGVDVIYPAENLALAHEIAAKGCRISEQAVGTEPQARHFPLRNRIISGLARAVIVVEAATRSGSLITARTALDQGREVFAVPGHPFDARASGCNMLIRDGATLIRGAADVIEAVGAAVRSGAVDRVGRTDADARLHDKVGPGVDRSAPLRHADGAARALNASDTRPNENAAVPSPNDRTAVAETLRRNAQSVIPPGPPERRSLADTSALHSRILARLGPSPLAEDQLIRDLALAPSTLAPELLVLELDGRILRQAGGLLSRSV